MLFKKGYLGKKKTATAVTPVQDSIETQSADSMESDQYMCEDQMQPQYMYHPTTTGYMDHTGLYYINNSVEVYDPYTGNVTVIVGPGYHTAPHTGVLTAVPCQPVPLQSLEWFNPTIPHPHPAYSVPMYSSKKKRNSIDSQNYSGQSSETTGPPGSPQEPIDGTEAPIYPQQYVYPGYMFGAPMYNMNGVTVQGVVPQSAPLPPPSADQAKRRKKRRRKRRGGVTDEGSESSCEDILSCDASGVAETNSGASSDTAPGSSSSKTNSDSGIHTDPTALTSGANSPRLPIDEPYFHHNGTNENDEQVSLSYYEQEEQCSYQTEVKSSYEPEITSSCQPEDTTSCQLEEINSFKQEVNENEETQRHTTVESDETIVSTDSSEPEGDEEHEELSEKVVMVEEKQDIVENTEEEEEIEKETNCENENNVEENILIKEECNELNENHIEVITNRLAEQSIQEENRERPITEAVTKWLRSQGSSAVRIPQQNSSSESEDDCIEEGEDALNNLTTGQKNVQGNPFLALSPSSNNGTRVAIYDCCQQIGGEDWSVKVNDMCEAKRSVNKYYSLGAEYSTEMGSTQPPPPSMVLKTAMHLSGHSGPFPCGICCIIQ
ncbi:hypothetical protein O3M35_002912 [Rhynocoris fuscipes]|uniref:Uncharacterized protein n=1 Tax=Rhynocoris fuscipes TaxID=488301 RepID=A0AAW1CQJ7_9HEMI